MGMGRTEDSPMQHIVEVQIRGILLPSRHPCSSLFSREIFSKKSKFFFHSTILLSQYIRLQVSLLSLDKLLGNHPGSIQQKLPLLLHHLFGQTGRSSHYRKGPCDFPETVKDGN